ncbi:MAG: hypothetical protein M1834_002857 [Cirrosporium novae-zelandiae]|nr:MAG: hypothetical protein M1834_002857 [Cirrosporium novae-zelandiae]
MGSRENGTSSPEPPKSHIADLLTSNKEWAAKTAEEDTELFPKCAAGQSPKILWIGCSDSRVPETTLLGLKPGDVFVHRNVGNVIHPGDISVMSVIEYAVSYVGVKHIIVCGHSGCGACNAALGNARLGLLDTWIHPLRKLKAQNMMILKAAGHPDRVLAELNVRTGVDTVKENPNVMAHPEVEVHGLMYDVGTGELRELDDYNEQARLRSQAFRLKA